MMTQKTKKTKSVKVPFTRLPKWKQRVLIAKDVIAQLKSKQLQASQGVYFEMPISSVSREHISFFDLNPESELQDVIKEKQCTVCARGALFVAAVRRVDKLKVRDGIFISNRNSVTVRNRLMDDYTRKIFSWEQAVTMEAAFENDVIERLATGIKYDRQLAATGMFLDESEEEKMIAIMRNVIRNKGVFVVPKKLIDKVQKERKDDEVLLGLRSSSYH